MNEEYYDKIRKEMEESGILEVDINMAIEKIKELHNKGSKSNGKTLEIDENL